MPRRPRTAPWWTLLLAWRLNNHKFKDFRQARYVDHSLALVPHVRLRGSSSQAMQPSPHDPSRASRALHQDDRASLLLAPVRRNSTDLSSARPRRHRRLNISLLSDQVQRAQLQGCSQTRTSGIAAVRDDGPGASSPVRSWCRRFLIGPITSLTSSSSAQGSIPTKIACCVPRSLRLNTVNCKPQAYVQLSTNSQA
jgi:hypothetical protein